MMDFGAGSVDLACYERSRIEKTEVIPVGGNLFTRDIAGVLGAPWMMPMTLSPRMRISV